MHTSLLHYSWAKKTTARFVVGFKPAARLTDSGTFPNSGSHFRRDTISSATVTNMFGDFPPLYHTRLSWAHRITRPRVKRTAVNARSVKPMGTEGRPSRFGFEWVSSCGTEQPIGNLPMRMGADVWRLAKSNLSHAQVQRSRKVSSHRTLLLPTTAAPVFQSRKMSRTIVWTAIAREQRWPNTVETSTENVLISKALVENINIWIGQVVRWRSFERVIDR